MAAGQVLPIKPPAPNATWTLDFWGPALQCGDVPKTKSDQIFTNTWKSYDIDDPVDAAAYAFLSWVPWSWNDYGGNEDFTSNPTPYLPFIFNLTEINTTSLSENISKIPKMGPPSSLVSTGRPLSLFIAALPGTEVISIAKSDPDPNYAGDTAKKVVLGKSGLCDYRSIGGITDTQQL